jgi:hypothetical protein
MNGAEVRFDRAALNKISGLLDKYLNSTGHAKNYYFNYLTVLARNDPDLKYVLWAGGKPGMLESERKTIAKISAVVSHGMRQLEGAGRQWNAFDVGDDYNEGPAMQLHKMEPMEKLQNVHDASTVDTSNFYANEEQPLFPYTGRFNQSKPELYGYGGNNILVEGPDGKVRRFPRDAGKMYIERTKHSMECLGVSLAEQTNIIYDAPWESIKASHAEYVIDPQAATMKFVVAGETAKSMLPNYAVYSLGDGKWMIPQPEFRDCTFACEYMLLAEGKAEDAVLQQLEGFEVVGARRSDDEIIKSLKFHTPREVIYIQDHPRKLSPAEFTDQLAANLERHGPCMLGMFGHVRILDSIERTEEGEFFKIRDPFSASYLTIKADEHFWTNPMQDLDEDTPRPNDFTAIFLAK